MATTPSRRSGTVRLGRRSRGASVLGRALFLESCAAPGSRTAPARPAPCRRSASGPACLRPLTSRASSIAGRSSPRACPSPRRGPPRVRSFTCMALARTSAVRPGRPGLGQGEERRRRRAIRACDSDEWSKLQPRPTGPKLSRWAFDEPPGLEALARSTRSRAGGGRVGEPRADHVAEVLAPSP